MKILFYFCYIAISINLPTYCLSEDMVVYEPKIDPSSTLREFTEIINIAQKQINVDAGLNVTQLIDKYGYPIKEYQVTTDDGYILTMFRIPNDGPVVFLMHGLLMSADDWVTAGPEDGLAYLLATSGYDVWMGNARGNKHSRRHVNISPENSTFWDFSWDEIGRKDLPAMIDFVLNTTNKTQLAYVGHSQGTTTFFVMCSELPEYNNKITIMIALAPLAWNSHTKSPLARAVAPFSEYAGVLLKLFQIHEVFPKPIDLQYMDTPICEIGNGIICTTILFFFCGFDYEQLNKTNIPVIFSHTPSGASANQFIHYLQNIASGTFRRYDYGDDTNLKIYGSRKPPKYHVDRIKAPIALFYSDNDWFSDIEDITTLKKKLPNVKDFYRVPFAKFNHIDYLWAIDVKLFVYARIIELLKFEPRTLKNF